MNGKSRIVLTGFMGVGKSTVAKCLSYIMQAEKIDLDRFMEAGEGRTIPEILTNDGEQKFRDIETAYLQKILTETDSRIIALGGGAWITEENRRLIKEHSCISIWLESTFEHCWRNINISKQERPLAKDKFSVEKLFNERQKYYCLADWHLIVKPELTSFDVAKFIAEEILC
jgi:shikimate kinase